MILNIRLLIEYICLMHPKIRLTQNAYVWHRISKPSGWRKCRRLFIILALYGLRSWIGETPNMCYSSMNYTPRLLLWYIIVYIIDTCNKIKVNIKDDYIPHNKIVLIDRVERLCHWMKYRQSWYNIFIVRWAMYKMI